MQLRLLDECLEQGTLEGSIWCRRLEVAHKRMPEGAPITLVKYEVKRGERERLHTESDWADESLGRLSRGGSSDESNIASPVALYEAIF